MPRSRFRTQLAATDQERAETLSAQLSRAEQFLSELPQQLAAVQATTASIAATVQTAARDFTTTAAKSGDARQAYTALTAAMDEAAATGQELAQLGRNWLGALRTRLWWVAGTIGLGPWLLLGLLLWAKSATAAALLMDEEQRAAVRTGGQVIQHYQDPQTPVWQRCAIEAGMNWPHSGPGRCPPIGPGSSGR